MALASVGLGWVVAGRALRPAHPGDGHRPPAVAGQPPRAARPRRPPRRAQGAGRHLRRHAGPAGVGLREPAPVRGQRVPRAAHPAGDPAHPGRRGPGRPRHLARTTSGPWPWPCGTPSTAASGSSTACWCWPAASRATSPGSRSTWPRWPPLALDQSPAEAAAGGPAGGARGWRRRPSPAAGSCSSGWWATWCRTPSATTSPAGGWRSRPAPTGRVRVTNSGPVVPPDQVADLFEPFRRLAPDRWPPAPRPGRVGAGRGPRPVDRPLGGPGPRWRRGRGTPAGRRPRRHRPPALGARRPDGGGRARHRHARGRGDRLAWPAVRDGGLDEEALDLLRRLTGDPTSEFRPDQLDVIRRLVGERQRVLMVQRTGWGKSAVYFIATRHAPGPGRRADAARVPAPRPHAQPDRGRRADGGAGGHHQQRQPGRVGRRSRTGSTTASVDILLISPERLANPKFRADVLPKVGADGAGCSSSTRPTASPTGATTSAPTTGGWCGCSTSCPPASRSCAARRRPTTGWSPTSPPSSVPTWWRCGGRWRGTASALHVLEIRPQAERLAWLAETIPRLPGTGIVYCLTIRDTERVAGWLESRGIAAVAYSGETDAAQRPVIEQALLANEVKVVVATSALGHGLRQARPGLRHPLPVARGRRSPTTSRSAGRAGPSPSRSGSCCAGCEDADIQDYFIRSAFPPPDLARQVVDLLEARAEPVGRTELLEAANVRQSQLELLLKTLEVEGAVERDGSRWLRTLRPWTFDHERVASVTALRRTEQAQMDEYASYDDGLPDGGPAPLPRRSRRRSVRAVRRLHRYQPGDSTCRRHVVQDAIDVPALDRCRRRAPQAAARPASGSRSSARRAPAGRCRCGATAGGAASSAGASR